MVEQERPAYCGQCGNRVQSGSRFCASCGAAILPPPPRAEQVIPQPVAASHAFTHRSRIRTFLLAGVLSLLLVLLGGGALAYWVIGFGSVSPDTPPDPAFDLYLTPLESMTEAPIMLPAELPNELKNFGIDENVKGDHYRITFLTTPPEDLVGGWAMAETVGSLEAVPTTESESDKKFEVVSTEEVRLPDGTEAKLRYMQPVLDTAMFGPRWEGTFDKGRYTYTLWVSVSQVGYVVSKQALSTMVPVEDR